MIHINNDQGTLVVIDLGGNSKMSSLSFDLHYVLQLL